MDSNPFTEGEILQIRGRAVNTFLKYWRDKTVMNRLQICKELQHLASYCLEHSNEELFHFCLGLKTVLDYPILITEKTPNLSI